MATHGEIRRPPAGTFDGRLWGDFHGRRQAKQPTRGGSTRARSRGRRDVAKPGARERQLLELVGARPGISVPEIGRELGVDATGLYGIVRRLESRGQLVKDGKQLRLAPTPTTGERPTIAP
jgi:hypothetical protein